MLMNSDLSKSFDSLNINAETSTHLLNKATVKSFGKAIGYHRHSHRFFKETFKGITEHNIHMTFAKLTKVNGRPTCFRSTTYFHDVFSYIKNIIM